eukprot:1158773-Pelagomonas_calceolata.AAC.7
MPWACAGVHPGQQDCSRDDTYEAFSQWACAGVHPGQQGYSRDDTYEAFSQGKHRTTLMQLGFPGEPARLGPAHLFTQDFIITAEMKVKRQSVMASTAKLDSCSLGYLGCQHALGLFIHSQRTRSGQLTPQNVHVFYILPA